MCVPRRDGQFPCLDSLIGRRGAPQVTRTDTSTSRPCPCTPLSPSPLPPFPSAADKGRSPGNGAGNDPQNQAPTCPCFGLQLRAWTLIDVGVLKVTV